MRGGARLRLVRFRWQQSPVSVHLPGEAPDRGARFCDKIRRCEGSSCEMIDRAGHSE
jgi:hypothetical protein